MKTKWTKEVPQVDGWYWVKYNGKDGKVICPAKLAHFTNPRKDYAWVVYTARNDYFCNKQEDLKFGNRIEEPI